MAGGEGKGRRERRPVLDVAGDGRAASWKGKREKRYQLCSETDLAGSTHHVLPRDPSDSHPSSHSRPALETPHLCPVKEVRDVPEQTSYFPAGIEPRVQEEEAPLETSEEATSTCGRVRRRRRENGSIYASTEREKQLVNFKTKIGNENLRRRSFSAGRFEKVNGRKRATNELDQA